MVDSRNWFKTLPESRRRKLLASQRNGLWLELDGARLLNFASNDYLGLSTHPEVCAATIQTIQEQGLGSGASRLVSGDDPILHQLEAELAAWKGFEDCLLVGSGMLANLGLLQALADRFTPIFSDKLNHASLVDGARLSGAKVFRYPHLDAPTLEGLLKKHTADKRMIVSDGVFSMDGDTADVQGLFQLAETYDALLVIDDAHGTGTVGVEGQGLVAQAKLNGNARIIEVGTLGKSFGSYGAYILGTNEMIEGLRQRMRTMIYSTALPSAVLAGAQRSLALIKQGDLVKRLHENIQFFLEHTSALNLLASDTAIQPVMMYSDGQALKASTALREQGFFVPAIRPPTVPEGEARLRITLSALHTQEDILKLIQALHNIGS